MRLFTAINFNDQIKAALTEVQDKMRFQGIRGNYTKSENLHLTLAFVGEYNDPEFIKEIIEGIRIAPFDIELQGLGSFGSLWWVGIKENDRLETLARMLRRRLAENDVPFDRKKFSPHVTLIRNPESPLPFAPNDYADIVKGVSMTVDHISLMRSDRGKNGMKYTEI